MSSTRGDSLITTTGGAIFGLIAAVAAFTMLCFCTNVKAFAPYADSVKADKLIEIKSLEDNCEKNICRNFYFDNVNEVAFFNLKEEVLIADDSTYDLGSPIDYDTLIFENSTFAHFPLHLFYSIEVKELDMRNCSIERITWENFLVANRLRVLLLSNNLLERIDELAFNFATDLQYLFLDSNYIDSLVSESFRDLNKLKLLHLQNNRLQSLPAGIFDYSPELHEINLSNNQLRTLTDDIFVKLPNLLTLILQSNQLEEISVGAFEQQTKFIILDLSHNQPLMMLVNNLSVKYLIAANCSLNRINIYGQVIDVDLRNNKILELYFSEPDSLQSLNLRNNELEQIVSLSSAKNLLVLDLANNPKLENLPDPWMVQTLKRLDLSNTGMSQLAMSSLGELKSLDYLNISANHISDINPRNFQYLQQLKHFYIHANDWNCYNLKMVMDILIRPHKMYFTPDTFDDDFPGEYINGIACMYRIEDSDEPSTPQVFSENYIVKSYAPNTDSTNEVESLRKELKVIVQFYEEKFDLAFNMINELKERMDKCEAMNNNTIWEHITITT